jgi:hypothetical protein
MNKSRALPTVRTPENSRPHCKFCNGLGAYGEQIEKVVDQFGHHYRVPVSHTDCKKSILTLSLYSEGLNVNR